MNEQPAVALIFQLGYSLQSQPPKSRAAEEETQKTMAAAKAFAEIKEFGAETGVGWGCYSLSEITQVGRWSLT